MTQKNKTVDAVLKLLTHYLFDGFGLAADEAVSCTAVNYDKGLWTIEVACDANQATTIESQLAHAILKHNTALRMTGINPHVSGTAYKEVWATFRVAPDRNYKAKESGV